MEEEEKKPKPVPTTAPLDYRKTLYALAAGFACFVGASTSLIELQSSIGVKHSIGTTSVLIGYVTSAISSVLLKPFLLKRYGLKTALLLGDILWPAFTLANFYPDWPTMIPGAIIFGIAQPMAMGTPGIIAASLGRSKPDKENVGAENQADIGLLWVFVCIGQFLTNGLVGIILKGTESIGLDGNETEIGTFSFHNINVSAEHLAQCASKDCPIEYAHEDDDHHKISKMLPNLVSLYILLGVYLAIQIVGITVHWIGLPSNIESESTYDIEMKEIDEPSTSAKQSSNEKEEKPSTSLLRKEKPSYFTDLRETFGAMWRHLSSIQGLLILPVTLYYGLFESFIWSEFSRAFVSCTVGVEFVGFTIAILDFFSLVTSLLITAGSKKFGIVTIVTSCFLVELFNYLLLLFWVPTPTNMYIPFLLAATIGVSHGLRRNATYLVSATNFLNIDIAFSLQLATESIGIAIGYGWSTPFCVDTKLYIMISLLMISSLSWAAGHFRLRKYNDVPF